MGKLRSSNNPTAKLPVQQVIVEKEVIKLVPTEVIVEKIVEVEKLVEVEKIIEIPVRVIETVEIEKIVEKEVRVPVKVIETVEVIKEKIVSDISQVNEEKQRTQAVANKLKTAYIVMAILVVLNVVGWAI